MSRILPIIILFALASCAPTRSTLDEYMYFQKNLANIDSAVVTLKEPVIQKNDILSINISSASLNQEQTQVFNLMNNAGAQGGGGAAQAGLMGYLVDFDGNITLPIIGKVPAAGNTKEQLSESLKQRLAYYVKDPVINIRFVNFRVMLMGETAQKGWVTFNNERATIVDAVLGSGGVTETALRSNVLLIRQNTNGKMETHRLDLNDARIFQSPYYQLQQNDIVYVLPNESKLIQFERQNSPFFRDMPVYMGLITSILAFVTLMISATK